jgi:glycosyltransferase involved in cell wall biosynthesis
MNVLVFTSLFPNNVQPNLGIFIAERIARVAQLPGVGVKVVAPVPWYPPLLPGWRSRYRSVLSAETVRGLDVLHPRYAMIPKVGMRHHGAMMLRSVLDPVRALHARHRFDVIDAHYLYPDGHAGIGLGHSLGLPVVVSARGSDVNRFAGLPRIRPMLESTLARADGVIAVSSALRDRMTELGAPASAIDVIPNGVDLAVYSPRDRHEARQRLGLPDRPTILYVGNLVPGKGLEALIDAVSRLGGGDDMARRAGLLLVGGGRLRPALEARTASLGVASGVRFAGEVAHAELADWYSAADVLCLASEREGWPNVLLEALACGTPVVATRAGGIPEIVTSDRVGILADGTPDAIAAALRDALRRDWDRATLRAHAEPYTWERAAEAVGRVFERALARRGARIGGP